jgi:hypothetical protein
MRTIEKPFKDLQRKQPMWGDYICLIEAVRGRKFSHKAIRKALLKHVSPEDYDKRDTGALVYQLHVASNLVEDVHFWTKIQLLEPISPMKDILVV